MATFLPTVFYTHSTLGVGPRTPTQNTGDALPIGPENRTTHAFAGIVPAEHRGTIEDAIESLDGWYGQALDALSRIGGHRWCSQPDHRVLCLGAFEIPQVPPAQILPLLQAWAGVLTYAPACAGRFGLIVALDTRSVQRGSDFDLYTAAVAAGSVPPQG